MDRKKEKVMAGLSGLKDLAKKGIDSVDMDAIKEKAVVAKDAISDKTLDIKEKAVDVKEDISNKINELDNMLNEAIAEYNDQYMLFSDDGTKLFIERTRSVDIVDSVTCLVNSIANRPKEFVSDFEEITKEKAVFKDACYFADEELKATRGSASAAGAGLAAGAAVFGVAPTAAMWIATTFGTASTGAAISTLSGAAATNAALAWLGGGTVAAGGSGMAGGTALLASMGPVGVGIIGASLLTSILVYAKKKNKLNQEKNEEIEAIKRNTESLKELDCELINLIDETIKLRDGLTEKFHDCMKLFGKDYAEFDVESKMKLGALVNNTKSLAALFGKTLN